MGTRHETKLQPLQVAVRPGSWLAHTADGRIVACCAEPRELERELRSADREPADVQFLWVPEQNDDELSLGGCEWSLDVEHPHCTEATAGENIPPSFSVPSNV